MVLRCSFHSRHLRATQTKPLIASSKKYFPESFDTMYRSFILLTLFLLTVTSLGAEDKKLVVIAGKPSHPPRMHEFNAGVQLLAKCLADYPGLDLQVSSK